MLDHFDAIVIGSGAGGGTLAHALAMAGKNILILERGGYVPREQENWSPRAVFREGRYVSHDTWYDSEGKPFQPGSHYNVGGATKFYGAALYRFRPQDFGAVQHVDGISPAWPLTYEDMEPWYTQAEWMYQVHGAHGEDPTEGHASRPYPWPAVEHEPRIAEISDKLGKAGYHPFHAPCGVLLNERTDPARLALPIVIPNRDLPCVKCATCDGHPCMIGAKSDAESIAIRPIQDMPNVTLITDAEVTRLHTSKRDHVITGVSVMVGGTHRRFYTADVVVVSAGAVNSAKLLLRSGIANGSDQVGRNYMCHNSRAVLALDAVPNPTRFQKTLGINDFYLSARDSAGMPGGWWARGQEWPLGNIQMFGKSNAEAMKGESRLAALAPGWALSKVARHAVDFWLTTEDLPLAENRVTLDRGGRVHLAYRSTNDREADALYGQLRAIMSHVGMLGHVYMDKRMGIDAVAHQAGTCRLGTDPATSVLDLNCKAHELGNLYVVDASFMPSVAAVNPALTIMANALRVASHLVSEVL